MTSLITRSSAAEFGAAAHTAGLSPDFVRTLPVASGPFGSNTFVLGIRFHSLLKRIKDRGWLNRGEKEMLPYLSALRDELRRALGVRHLEPEVTLRRQAELPDGRCDLLLTGGLAPMGVAEVKVTDVLPEAPCDPDLMQLAGYEELVARNRIAPRLWGCVAYVSFAEKRMRLLSIATPRNCGGFSVNSLRPDGMPRRCARVLGWHSNMRIRSLDRCDCRRILHRNEDLPRPRIGERLLFMDGEEEFLTRAFAEARLKADAFTEEYNRRLPIEHCPQCGDSGHVPGLRCPACGYRHHEPWAIIRDTEWGYEVVALTNRQKILANFAIGPIDPNEGFEFRG